MIKNFSLGFAVHTIYFLNGGEEMIRKWKKIPLEEAQKHDLYGVEGWLAWFCGMNIFVLPLLFFFSTRENLEPSSADMGSDPVFIKYRFLTIGICIFMNSLSILSACMLYRVKRWGSVVLAVIVIWIGFLYSNIIDPIVASNVFDISIKEIFSAMSEKELYDLNVSALKHFLMGLVWTGYFIFSRRVRVTYANSVIDE